MPIESSSEPCPICATPVEFTSAATAQVASCPSCGKVLSRPVGGSWSADETATTSEGE